MKPEELVPRLLDNPSAPVYVVGRESDIRKGYIEH